jgi:hypothetical protein
MIYRSDVLEGAARLSSKLSWTAFVKLFPSYVLQRWRLINFQAGSRQLSSLFNFALALPACCKSFNVRDFLLGKG